MTRAFRALACAVSACLSLSCTATIVRSGLPAGGVPEAYDERWESSFFWGTLPVGPVDDLRKICPDGWSEIRAEARAPTALVGWLTLGLYTPANVTITCAAGERGAGAPLGEGPLVVHRD